MSEPQRTATQRDAKAPRHDRHETEARDVLTDLVVALWPGAVQEGKLGRFLSGFGIGGGLKPRSFSREGNLPTSTRPTKATSQVVS